MEMSPARKIYVDRNSYLFTQLRYLQVLGMWPLDSTNQALQFAHKVCTVYMIVTLAWLTFGQLVQICVLTSLEERSSAIDLFTLTACGLYKMVFYIVRQKDVQRMVDTVNTTFADQSPDGSVTMRRWLRNSKPLTLCYMASGFVVFVAWILSPIIDKYTIIDVEIISNNSINSLSTLNDIGTSESFCNTTHANGWKNVTNNKNNSVISCRLLDNGINSSSHTEVTTLEMHAYNLTQSERNGGRKLFKFPVNCWYPFDVTQSPVFEIIFILEVITLFGVTHLYVATDCFFFVTVYTVCGQLEVLSASLRYLRVIAERHDNNWTLHGSDVESLVVADGTKHRKPIEDYSRARDGICVYIERKLNSELVECIKFHSMLLTYLRELERMASSLIAVDVLHAIISLSFAMLQTSISVSFSELLKMVLFVALCVWHQFLNNYFAESVIQKQIQIVEAAYDTPWEDRPQSFKRNVHIVMMRAYHPIIFNAFKLYYLGHNTFMEFMRVLVSYFMVLRELQANK